MTVEEAIKRAIRCIAGVCDKTCSGYSTYCLGGYEEIASVLEKVLKEYEQYRAIGTIEEFKALKQWKSDIIESFSKYDVNSVDELMKRFRELDESEAKWKEKEAELRASVIDEFAEAIMVKATEESEKAVFDGGLVADVLTLDCVSDMVVEIALQMKGEKE